MFQNDLPLVYCVMGINAKLFNEPYQTNTLEELEGIYENVNSYCKRDLLKRYLLKC